MIDVDLHFAHEPGPSTGVRYLSLWLSSRSRYISLSQCGHLGVVCMCEGA